MSNTRQSVSESDTDPLNSTINSRSNVRMYIPPERAESNPNISGFIDESLYTGLGTRLQSQWEENETNTERILSAFHSSAHFSSVEINRRFNLLNIDVKNLSRRALMAAVSTRVSSGIPSQFFHGIPSQFVTEFREISFRGILFPRNSVIRNSAELTNML